MTEPKPPDNDHLPTAAKGTEHAIIGPSFLNGPPAPEAWDAFAQVIVDPACKAITELWLEKARACGGVPLRSDFKFEKLARLGSNLVLFKLDEDDRWLTKFCGSNIVEILGFELTGKHLEDYASENSLEFWMASLKHITDEGRPFFEYYNMDFVEKEYMHCTAINLPLKSGERDYPDALFEALAFLPEPPQLPSDP